MQTWQMDPTIGDYVMDSGAPEQTNSLQVPAYFRMKIKRTKWMYAPDKNYGSDFYTIAKRPSENGNQRLEGVAIKALQPLVDDGRAQQVTANVTENTRNGAAMDTVIVDASGQVEQTTFKGIF
jgi:phage gp46-like protein